MATLISFSGLPGVGKTTIAKALSRRIKAVHLRVDSIEAAMKTSALKIHPAMDAGYLVVAAVAKDNLMLGFDVIADTVSPLEITRQLWAETAASSQARLTNVEVICSDIQEHRRRVETRLSDLDGLTVPTWDKVRSREYEPWTTRRLVLDSAELTTAECVSRVEQVLG